MGDESDEMRLDALAAAAGVATTTIRLYQQRGLLPGPRLAGRTGWYGPHHLERLQTISHLQDQGFSLAGIAQLLELAERGGDLTALLGGDALEGALPRPEPVVLEPSELLGRLGAQALTPAVMARAVELGLVEGTDDGRLRVPDRRFLDVGAALVELGVSPEVVLEEWAALRAVTDRIAEDFIAVFEREILGGPGHEVDDVRLAEAAEVLPRLSELAQRVVAAAFDASLVRVVDGRLADLEPRGRSDETD
jgi:DNA-binding transcriptional MerR regulator